MRQLACTLLILGHEVTPARLVRQEVCFPAQKDAHSVGEASRVVAGWAEVASPEAVGWEEVGNPEAVGWVEGASQGEGDLQTWLFVSSASAPCCCIVSCEVYLQVSVRQLDGTLLILGYQVT